MMKLHTPPAHRASAPTRPRVVALPLRHAALSPTPLSANLVLPALFLASVFLASVFLARPAQAQEVQRGSWTAKGFDIDGSWSIVNEGSQAVLVLDEGFSTKSAPDLKIFLSPKPLAQLENRNATDGAVLVARLKSNRGAQRYPLPGDFASYVSLIIHCEKYSKLWGGADLR
ncbi:MAG: DM13 domain-containing protein [Acidobacteriota bacterium]